MCYEQRLGRSLEVIRSMLAIVPGRLVSTCEVDVHIGVHTNWSTRIMCGEVPPSIELRVVALEETVEESLVVEERSCARVPWVRCENARRVEGVKHLSGHHLTGCEHEKAAGEPLITMGATGRGGDGRR